MTEISDETDERLQPLLRAMGVGKSFVGNRVLDAVDLDVMPGEVHAIIGENGAGKSTLIKILGGVYQPDGGELLIGGEARRFRSPREALAAGIVVIHQELSLAPSLSAEENIFLGRFPRNALGIVDRRLMRGSHAGAVRTAWDCCRAAEQGRVAQYCAAADGGNRQGHLHRRADSRAR